MIRGLEAVMVVVGGAEVVMETVAGGVVVFEPAIVTSVLPTVFPGRKE